MTKITGAMLYAIKRSKMTEAEILAALAPRDVTSDALDGSRKKRAYNRRDMRADA